ncbi:siroheme synthase CysG [Wenxinia saemankumensis]|uniref:Uroporphyrin-III C-methyltransferase / precorrin-2 dehydrogenase / sirohydrochlorin ferrochelatase n=1 Tax=Wenxinia saemankumensis TaxID=1447782 RepID=A0A1M6AM62_9RHOB|nr:siroheme synthase CysG [Wenxinia saemankumensis]SHI37580.1 uroporphyrin-III C-methyltransferase / precorrin-2 dehydrogenase / sirohydrochlorin ferrochelatase [Wenxinia saemankumensis]
MRHFPLFLDLRGRRVVLAGGGETALAKLRLILKTEARVTVFAADPAPALERLADEGKLTLVRRDIDEGDAVCAALVYAAADDDEADARTARIGRHAGALVNVVDNLEASQFITPAIVDRDPVVVAIGTEGAAPVLARRIKADLESRLPASLGLLARMGRAFRKAAEALPHGAQRRDFWARYYDRAGPEALARGGEAAVERALSDTLDAVVMGGRAPGHVWFVGAGPGDPDLLTMKARRALDEADVVIFDRLVAPPILELARREAVMIDAGKEGFGPSVPQAEIDATIADHARKGRQVVRLKSGDPTIFGRLDEEIAACEAAGVDFTIVPGITAASAAVAGIGQSLTRRGRNAGVRFLTGHDVQGFAEHDWQALARPGEVAAIYMGKRAARYVQGRLMMHGADPATPVSVIENASRPDQRILSTTLSRLEPDLTEAGLTGPALILLGLAPRAALALAADHPLERIAR